MSEIKREREGLKAWTKKEEKERYKHKYTPRDREREDLNKWKTAGEHNRKEYIKIMMKTRLGTRKNW